jgi:uncharacterized protein YjcR
MHGGAKASGAPTENKNALKHGSYSKEAYCQRAKIQELIAEVAKLIKEEAT